MELGALRHRRDDTIPSMAATSEQFLAIRDEAWAQDHADAMECRHTEELIQRVTALWDADRQGLAAFVPSPANRDAIRTHATVLRDAEQAMSALSLRASRSIQKGYTVELLGELLACRTEVRLLLLQPIARRMAEHDVQNRAASAIASILLRRVRFEDGRPVMTEDAMVDLPSPFAAEAVT